MRDFNKDYLRLLKDQVEVEIRTLQHYGHDQEIIPNACIWCYQGRKGETRCNRLNELRNFLSQIVVRMNQKVIQSTMHDYQFDNDLRLLPTQSQELLPESAAPF